MNDSPIATSGGDKPKELTALDLVKKCVHSGEEPYWSEFVCRFQPVIIRVVTNTARRYARPSAALVDDLVQSTYLKLCVNQYRALKGLDGRHENTIYGLLKVVASNVVRDHFRGVFSRKRGTGMCDFLNEEIAASIRCVPEREDRAARILSWQIEKCLRKYASTERDLQVFRLYYSDGFSAREISALTGIGVGTKGVESILHRLTQLLRVHLS